MDQRDRHSKDDDDGDEREQVQIACNRSDSMSLLFDIAHVLRSNSTMVSPPPLPYHHPVPPINPWFSTLQQVSQSPSSSGTALANALNWCATCWCIFGWRLVSFITFVLITPVNSSFRSTSNNGRRREKQMSNSSSLLKCHICSETSRQGHHLTRHMTSHRWLKQREFILIKESKQRD